MTDQPATCSVADQDIRKLEDAPLIEICNAAIPRPLHQPRETKSFTRSKEIAKHFGFSRVTQKTTQLCDAGVQHLTTEQTIILEAGFYKISN